MGSRVSTRNWGARETPRRRGKLTQVMSLQEDAITNRARIKGPKESVMMMSQHKAHGRKVQKRKASEDASKRNLQNSHRLGSSERRERTPRQVEAAVVVACSRFLVSHHTAEREREEGEGPRGQNVQVGHESATRALILLPVSDRVISTYCPQCDPPP